MGSSVAAAAASAAELRRALRAGLPAAALLAVALGTVLVVGANLSNSFPSAENPYGWPGAANFENGVAMVRPELVLAASLPALLLGLRALPRDGSVRPLAGILAGAVLTAGAVLAGTMAGVAGAAVSPPDAYFAFWVAHSLLALSCFSLGFLAHAASRRHAAVAGLAAWGGFAFVMDNVLKLQVFRTVGYAVTQTGLPGWFFVAQALNPVSAYRAVLILWRPGFRDYLEHRALDGAAIPGWLSPGTIVLVILLVWVVLPLAAACALHAWKARRSGRGSPAPVAIVPGAAAPAAVLGAASPVPASTVDVAPERPPPHRRGLPLERPSLKADARTHELRASFRPPRPKRR